MEAIRGQKLNAGDPVSWIGLRGIVTGRVVRNLTTPSWVGGGDGRLGTRVRASEEFPYVLVESDLERQQFAQRPEQLTRI
jgi:Hypervirulence associated proteins TUDOR domain